MEGLHGSGATAALAAFVARTSYDDLPEAALRHARRALLDGLGVAIGGSTDPAIDILLAYGEELGGKPQASIWGRKARTSAPLAALVNGASAHVLDFDDTHFELVLHQNAPVLPAALALAEERGADGRRFLSAFVVGMEVAARIGLAVGQEHHERGWHPTATLGTFGAAAAASSLLRLEAPAVAHAFGLAASLASGLQVNRGSMAKAFHAGRAAMLGLMAASLVARGFNSSAAILERPGGFFELYSGELTPELALERLGERFVCVEAGFKPYPCAVVIHSAVDGILELRAGDALLADKVERVEVNAHPLVARVAGLRDPRSGLECKSSLFHCCASALLNGALGLEAFTDPAANDPQVVELRQRIALEIDPGLRRDEARVAVVLRDGSRRERHVRHARGGRQRPMDDQELRQKFLALVVPVLQRPGAVALLDGIATIETRPDAGELARASCLGV